MALRVGGISPVHIAGRKLHFKDSAFQRNVCASLDFDDLQPGFRLIHLLSVTVGADCGHTHCASRVGIAHIVLQLAVFIGLHARGVKYCILIDIGAKSQLYGTTLTSHTIRRVKDLALSGVNAAVRGGCDGTDLVVIHIHNLCARGYGGRIGKRDLHRIVADPCSGLDRDHLLLIGNTIDGDGIRLLTVDLSRQRGRQIGCPSGAAGVDVLSGRKNLLRTL